MTRHLTRNQLIELIEEGCTQEQAARELRCSVKTVHLRAKQWRLRWLGPGKRQLDPVLVARALDLVASGLNSGAAVARVVGRSDRAVLQWFYNLERRGLLTRRNPANNKSPGWVVTRKWRSDQRSTGGGVPSLPDGQAKLQRDAWGEPASPSVLMHREDAA